MIIVAYLANTHPDAVETFGKHGMWHLDEMPLDQSKQEKVMLISALAALKKLRDTADLVPKDSS